MTATPLHLDLQREVGLRVDWNKEISSFYSVAFLRKMSPSADTKATQEELAQNPLAILPSTGNGPLTIEEIELVGNYAVRFVFSDGHTAGIYSWEYLQSLEPPIDG
ncbi:MAG: DUF971 domain-containing protein [Phycisphaerales bacterium]|nr:DUF971 domain-containing protein [Phycisphaerales bacterium]